MRRLLAVMVMVGLLSVGGSAAMASSDQVDEIDGRPIALPDAGISVTFPSGWRIEHVVSLQTDRAGGWLQKAGQDPDGRGLAGAVRAQETQYLARRQLQVNVVERGDVLEVFRETSQCDRGRAVWNGFVLLAMHSYLSCSGLCSGESRWLAPIQGLGRQFTEQSPVITCKLAHVPEAAAVCHVTDCQRASRLDQLRAHPQKAATLQMSLRPDAEAFLESAIRVHGHDAKGPARPQAFGALRRSITEVPEAQVPPGGFPRPIHIGEAHFR